MQQHYDVLIIGGGLAGGCLALALQDSGLQIAMVEAITEQQRQNAAIGNRALALAYGTTKMLDALSFWQEIKHKATPIKHIHISDQGHFAKSRLAAECEGVEALAYVIKAHDIEQAVNKHVKQSEVTLICPGRLQGLITDASTVYASLKVADESVNITANLIVGADGGDSSVRRLLEIQQSRRDYQQKAIVATIKSFLGHNNIAYERFTATGPLALLPTENNCSSLIWTRSTEQAEQLMTGSDACFIEALQQCFGYRMGELSLQSSRFAFPLSLIRAKHIVSGRGVIVGNAAHQLHPVAGQGFNLGLRDVVQLAEMLIQQSQHKGDVGAPDFLNRYATARKGDHDRMVNFTDGIVRLFSNEWLAVAVSRGLGLVMLDHIGSAKSYLTRHAMGLASQLPRVGNSR